MSRLPPTRPPAPPAPPPPPGRQLPGAPLPRQNPLELTAFLFVGFKAIFAIVSSLVIAVLGPFVLYQIQDISAKHEVQVAAIVKPFLASPMLVSLICVPAVVAGVWAMVDRKHRWIALIISTLFLLGSLAIVLVALLSALKPMYESVNL